VSNKARKIEPAKKTMVTILLATDHPRLNLKHNVTNMATSKMGRPWKTWMARLPCQVFSLRPRKSHDCLLTMTSGARKMLVDDKSILDMEIKARLNQPKQVQMPKAQKLKYHSLPSLSLWYCRAALLMQVLAIETSPKRGTFMGYVWTTTKSISGY
jgi:hypothetical protein